MDVRKVMVFVLIFTFATICEVYGAKNKGKEKAPTPADDPNDKNRRTRALDEIYNQHDNNDNDAGLLHDFSLLDYNFNETASQVLQMWDAANPLSEQNQQNLQELKGELRNLQLALEEEEKRYTAEKNWKELERARSANILARRRLTSGRLRDVWNHYRNRLAIEESLNDDQRTRHTSAFLRSVGVGVTPSVSQPSTSAPRGVTFNLPSSTAALSLAGPSTGALNLAGPSTSRGQRVAPSGPSSSQPFLIGTVPMPSAAGRTSHQGMDLQHTQGLPNVENMSSAALAAAAANFIPRAPGDVVTTSFFGSGTNPGNATRMFTSSGLNGPSGPQFGQLPNVQMGHFFTPLGQPGFLSVSSGTNNPFNVSVLSNTHSLDTLLSDLAQQVPAAQQIFQALGISLAAQDSTAFSRNLDEKIQQTETLINQMSNMQSAFSDGHQAHQAQQAIIQLQQKLMTLMKAKIFMAMCAERRVPHRDAVRILRGNRDAAQLFNQLLHIPQSALAPLFQPTQQPPAQNIMSGYPQPRQLPQLPRLPQPPLPPQCFVCNQHGHGYANCPVFVNARGAQRAALERHINERLVERNMRPKFANQKPPPPP
jgi:hypothetical protein